MVGKWRIITEGGNFAALHPDCETRPFLRLDGHEGRYVQHSSYCHDVGGCCFTPVLADALAHVDRAVMEARFQAPALEVPC